MDDRIIELLIELKESQSRVEASQNKLEAGQNNLAAGQVTIIERLDNLEKNLDSVASETANSINKDECIILIH